MIKKLTTSNVHSIEKFIVKIGLDIQGKRNVLEVIPHISEAHPLRLHS
jgi:hypothetical protein